MFGPQAVRPLRTRPRAWLAEGALRLVKSGEDETSAQRVKNTADPGEVLRSLRLQKGWTLSDVSARTGLPISTLSKIENGKMSLSYDKLARISTGLEIDIGSLFAKDRVQPPVGLISGRRSVTRAGDGRAIETNTYGHLYPASDLLNKRFVPIVAELKARTLEEFGEMIRHPGEEYAFVLEGVVELHTDLYAPVRLEAGDSIYFDSGMGHAYLAVGEGPCRLLSICSGEETQIQAVFEAQPSTPLTRPANLDAQPSAPRARRSRAAGGRTR